MFLNPTHTPFAIASLNVVVELISKRVTVAATTAAATATAAAAG